jgi:hypothetical protein
LLGIIQTPILNPELSFKINPSIGISSGIVNPCKDNNALIDFHLSLISESASIINPIVST